MYPWLTLVSMNMKPGVHYIAPEGCTLQMQPRDATSNYVQYYFQNITSETPWVKLVHVSKNRFNS